MSAICEERWMLIHAPEKSSFFGPMSEDPVLIREKLFTGIDRDYNVINMGIVVEVIGELEKFHITKEALEATRLGKHINELRRKSSDKILANRAKSLVKKWRSMISTPAGEPGPPPGGGGGANGGNNNSLAATNGNTRLAAVSPGLPPASVRSSNLSPVLRGAVSNLSPPLARSVNSPGGLSAAASNLSPGLPRHNLSPGLNPRQQSIVGGMRSNPTSPSLPPISRQQQHHLHHHPHNPHQQQAQSVPPSPVLSLHHGNGGRRSSAKASPSVSRSATPRVSPATVTISSSGSSPSNSRPSSPHRAGGGGVGGGSQAFRPLNNSSSAGLPSNPNSRSPSPEIEIIDEVVNTPRPPPPPAAAAATLNHHKRLRRDESDIRLDSPKRQRLDFKNQNAVNGVDVTGGGGAGNGNGGGVVKQLACDSAAVSNFKSDNSSSFNHHSASSHQQQRSSSKIGHHPPPQHHLQQPPQGAAAASDMAATLNKQISMAKRSGKVKTTQELAENLGIGGGGGGASSTTRVSPSSSGLNSLVPSENKEELMKRFFESQQRAAGTGNNVSGRSSPADSSSRPGSRVAGLMSSSAAMAAAAVTLSSSASNSVVSPGSSRAATPAATPAAGPTTVYPRKKTGEAGAGEETVDDVLSQLPPLGDAAAVLAEWYALAAADETDDEEIDGLIPVYKPPPRRLEVTDKVVAELNSGELEHVGGIRDHAGVFREWHEMVARETKDGELLHILPYSVID